MQFKKAEKVLSVSQERMSVKLQAVTAFQFFLLLIYVVFWTYG